ncbi:MAG: amino acid ABC transporter permease [Acidimicrobiia bacterium]
MTHKIILPDDPDALEIAPEPPPHGPRVWLTKNLFSTPASAVLSIVFIGIALLVYRGLLSFVFNEERRWEAVTFNVRLLMVQSYPDGQIARVWVSVAIVAVLLAVSFAVYRFGGHTTPRKVGNTLSTIGAFIGLGGLVGPWGISLSPFGVESMRGFLGWVIVGFVIFAMGYAIRMIPGDRAKDPSIPVMGVVLAGIGLLLTALWTISLPLPARDDAGAQITVFEPIANTTRQPWTAIALLAIAAYVVVRLLRDRIPEQGARKTLLALWVLSFPVIVLVILRDPGLDYGRVLAWYLPVALGFVVVGGLILNFVAGSRGELGKAIGAVLLILAVASFLIPLEFVVRFSLFALALFALAAPTFGGKGSTRRAFLGIWIGSVVVIVFFVMVISAPSTVAVAGNLSPFGGLLLTIVLSVVAIVLSFPIGVVLALGRTSSMPIFRLMSTAYIELIRGVPLITWLIVAFIMMPVALPAGIEIGNIARAIGAMTFFSAAYLAENVRGGLQALPRGQYEASQAMGLTTTQTTAFIVLPQALRAVIPALVGQVIALFKDTSLVTIVGLADFLHIARVIVPSQTQPFNFLGVMREPILFAAAVYWMFTYTFSRISQRLEKKLGVGER